MGLKEIFNRSERVTLEDQILTIASQWQMDGTPWFSSFTMGSELRERSGKLVGPGSYISSLLKLEEKKALEARFGQREAQSKPLETILDPETDGDMNARYYRITIDGNAMRKPLSESQSKHVPRGIPQSS